jgi:ATP-dependent Lhr-like helicase
LHAQDDDHDEPDGAVLSTFLLPVAQWFREAMGSPTPAQRDGWPAIASCRNTLIFAPTGSGKTLAAFLAALDYLWRYPRPSPGVRILYVSPLKALNQDVARNLRAPLDGISATANRLGIPLPELSAAVRTGDSTPSERQRLIRRPPDILITTPESLHLMLTSRARETLRGITHVIIDEIHALAPNKRGVFLSLLLERLERINPSSFVRVGLSATQRPLEEVARYLGGRDAGGVPRPVHIVDAGRRREIDLSVSLPARTSISSMAESVWPAIESRLAEWIAGHRSTIIFANNRRVAERLTSRLNAADPEETLAQAHHGSLSPERRRATEDALKAGTLPAVVATASLELGIDMGAVDLVCQVESPGSIARGLQRVGRAGHLVGGTSKGRFLAKTADDLLESAALARAMLRGEVERLRVPSNCLDVLAQQIVACVAVEPMDVSELFALVRQAYPYRNLSPEAFEAILMLVSGRYHSETFRTLRPRISWDRVHNRLRPLPGSSHAALMDGGTIPDSGAYPLYLGDDGPKLGELDEEFVLERRVGETFVLGTSTWRIDAIEPQRVVVSPAQGRSALVPFWRGEAAGRSPELGEAVAALTRAIAERIGDPDLPAWLVEECRLEEASAQTLIDLIVRQIRQAGAAPDDRTILVETFRDPAGELGLAILTPFGGKLHHALKLAIQGRLRERFGVDFATLHSDEGLLIRLPDMERPPLDVFQGLTRESAETLIRAELGESALLGLRFRQAAGRALLMPRPDPSKRAPLWLQRLRAKDLLQGVKKVPDFPILVEAYRECLDEDLDLPRLRSLLDGIGDGTIRVAEHQGENPSPFTAGLVFQFSRKFLYEWDTPRPSDRPRTAAVDGELLDPLLDAETYRHWIDAGAVARVESRLRGVGHPPRAADEMAERLRLAGDLTDAELFGPMKGFLDELKQDGRAETVHLPGTPEPDRWINTEDAALYARAFVESDDDAIATIAARFLRSHALVGLAELLARYPIEPALATDLLERLTERDGLVRVEHDGETLWADRRNLDDVRRLSIAIKRRESVAVAPEVFAEFVVRRQHAHPETRLEGKDAVPLVLETLQGFAATPDVWENEILPRRLRDFCPAWLDDSLSNGGWRWHAQGDPLRVAIVSRDFPGAWPVLSDEEALTEAEARVLDALGRRGAQFVDEIARESGLEPSRVRSALDALVARGKVTNDRFDPLRADARSRAKALSAVASRPAPHSGRPRLGSFRRLASLKPEGRWSLDADSDATTDAETSNAAWCAVLLQRYGVLTRETVELDPWAPPWRELAGVLANAELRDEIRRGYFVEGLSGIQYALADTVDALSRFTANADRASDPLMLATLDPANLYGSGAPLDVPLLDGGTVRLSRSPGNTIVQIAGRPVLIVEGQGKRLTALASASEAEVRAALALLPGLASPPRRVLKVESFNTQAALASPAAPWLAEIGFVRDHPGMAYYGGWPPERTRV